jgi:hypothetical protein
MEDEQKAAWLIWKRRSISYHDGKYDGQMMIKKSQGQGCLPNSS